MPLNEEVKINYPGIEVSELAEIIRESTAKHQPGPLLATPTDNLPSENSSMLRLQPQFHPKAVGEAYSLNDLLQFHDRAFVESAYRAILGRYPSEMECSLALNNLRSGRFNKIDLLASMRYSTEGKAKAVRVDGLQTHALFRKAGRLPIVGYLVQIGIAITRFPTFIRNQRQFEGYVLSKQQEIADFTNGLLTERRELEKQTVAVRGELRKLESALANAQEEQRSSTLAVTTALEEHSTAFEQRTTETRQNLERQLEGHARQWSQRLDEASAAFKQQFESAIATTIRQMKGEFSEAISQRHELTQSALNEFAAELQRLNYIQQLIRSEITIAHTATPQLSKQTESQPESNARSDAFYAALEDRFRGSPQELKKRLSDYLPYVREVQAGDNRMLIDLGCGRGEWLQLLKDENLEAIGVDTNRIFISQCRELGLKVFDEDVLSYLMNLESDSVAAVTAFQLIEHLEINYLLRVLDEIMRVLKPSGLVLLETPNPDNVLVGSNFFYFDPSHRNPLPSQMVELLLETRGFQRIEVKNVNAWESGRVAGRGELAERFNGLFYGPMDYAILGWKPSA